MSDSQEKIELNNQNEVISTYYSQATNIIGTENKRNYNKKNKKNNGKSKNRM
jgi:hypothetical protein